MGVFGILDWWRCWLYVCGQLGRVEHDFDDRIGESVQSNAGPSPSDKFIRQWLEYPRLYLVR